MSNNAILDSVRIKPLNRVKHYNFIVDSPIRRFNYIRISYSSSGRFIWLLIDSKEPGIL